MHSFKNDLYKASTVSQKIIRPPPPLRILCFIICSSMKGAEGLKQS